MDCAHAAVRTELRLILSNALLLPPFSAQGRQSLFAIKPCPPLHRLRERMSRRKQDNPMQLKRTLTGAAADEDMDPDPLEADEAPQHDLIQCGDCHTSFALADIVKFIAHKRSCYKGQQVPLVVSSNEDDDKDESAAEVTSIDTTIHETEPIVRTEKPKILTPFRRKSLHDLSTAGDVRPLAKETQTDQLRDEVPNEPLICSTCKGSFYSAAELLRHVQEDHGLHIYQAESKDDPAAEMEEPSIVKEIIEENEEESKDSTIVERSPRESNPEEQAEPPSEGHRDEVKSFPEPDAAESQVSSSHPQEPAHVPHSQHMPLISDSSQLPIYIRHPLGGADRYQLGNSDRYFPVPLSQPFHMDFNMPPNHQPSEAVPGMSSPYEGSAHVPFSSASSHSSQVDESAAHRLRLIADVATPRDQMGFSSYSRPYRSSFPPKLKSCEFCGKPFKFQSNLIVHRRSHTGEKPYKCSLCDHACSQASKLKRHMKTHKNVNKDHTGSSDKTPNGRESSSGDGKHMDDDCGSSGKNSSNNSTVDEDEEEIELEEEDEVPPQNEEHRHTNSPREEHSSSSSRGSSQQPSNSLLCEVMKKTGLSEIQQYKDAYRQAMAEQNITVSPTQLYGCTVSSLLSGKPEINGPLAAGSSRLTPTSSPSPSRQKTPLPSPGQKTLPLPPSIPSHPFESSPPPLELDRECPKRFKLEPTSPPSARTPPRAPIWTSLNLPHHQNFFAPVLSMNSSLQHHPPVLPSPVHHNGSLNILPANHRRFYPRSSEPPVAPSVLPSFHNPHRNRRGGIANRRTDECEFCGKVFKNCSNLTVHRRSHTGEKPYKCELCSYACAQSSKLTRHMKTHGKGAKEVFKCEVCGMPFSVYSTLEKHMKKEHWGSIKGPAPRPDTSIGGRSHSYKPLPK